MRKDVQYLGKTIGEILWETDGYGVQVSLDCEIPGDPLLLLRCYGQTETTPFLIGLPEPLHGRLKLKRRLSRETLKEAGCLETPPTVFYLSENGAASAIPTGQSASLKSISEPPAPRESPKTVPERPASKEPPKTVPEQPASKEPPKTVSEPSASALTDSAPVTETPLYTGDDILDELLTHGDITGVVCGETIILRCPFLPDQPFALAPAFVLCAVRDGEAILRWHPDTKIKN